jgi:hypothetical protein
MRGSEKVNPLLAAFDLTLTSFGPRKQQQVKLSLSQGFHSLAKALSLTPVIDACLTLGDRSFAGDSANVSHLEGSSGDAVIFL